jgi:hypothetical protein
MLFALGAFLLMLLSFALRTCYITYYFLGFLYAVGQARAGLPGEIPGNGK